MNPALILTLFFAATAWADRERIFYVKVKGNFKSMTYSHFIDLDDPNSSKPKSHSTPVFTLESNGVACTGQGTNKKYFGYVNGSMVLGSREKVKPFELSMDCDSKVLNLFIQECIPPSSSSGEKLAYNKDTAKLFKCSPADLYFKTPIEGSSPAHALKGIKKRAEVEEEDFSDMSELRFFVEKRHVAPSKTTERKKPKTFPEHPSVESAALDTSDNRPEALPITDYRGNKLPF